MTVVPFKTANPPSKNEEPRIWVCGHCGSQNFLLYENGATECSLCHFTDAEQRGGWASKVQPDKDFDDNRPRRENIDHGTADFARAAVLKSVDANTVALAAIWPDGRIRLWSIFDNSDSPERKAWLRQAFKVLAGLAFGEPVDAGELPE